MQDNNADVAVPFYYYARHGAVFHKATEGSAGYDLAVHCCTHNGDTLMVGTGIFPVIPEGYTGLVFERSSLHNTGWVLANSVGVIDSDYRGEIQLVLRPAPSLFKPPQKITPGTRVAQLVIVPAPRVQAVEITKEEHAKHRTERGAGGFGSTGGGQQ